MPERRKKRLARLLLLQLALWPLALLVAEGGYRAWTRWRGAPYDGEATLESIRRIADALADDLPDPGGRERPAEVGSLLHPYVGFGPEYMLDTQAREWHRFAEGRRDASEYLILLVGGSVAGGFGNEKSAGVREFVRVLEEDGRLGGRPVRFLAYGYGGYKQPQQVNLVQYLISIGIVPDAVLNLDGFNEVALALTNGVEGVHPSYPVYSKWTHRVGDRGADVRGVLARAAAIEEARARIRRWAARAEAGLWRSAALGRLVLDRVRAAARDHARATDEYLAHLRRSRSDASVRGPLHPQETGAILATAARIWEECSRSLHALCSERGIYYFHALQPTLHDVGSKPLTEEERGSGRTKETWSTGAEEGYPLLRAAGERLRTGGVAFHDASRAFADVAETLYYDACHFNQLGNGLLGRELGAAFLEHWP